MSQFAPETPFIESGKLALGAKSPPLIIAGPDSLESEELALGIASELSRLQDKLQVPFVFKGSYDKANRSSHLSYRGPGFEDGMAVLRRVREETGLAVTSDVHTVEEATRAAEVLDILQVPAFLCRQNDLLQACASTGKIVNIKKGQFLARQTYRPGQPQRPAPRPLECWLPSGEAPLAMAISSMTSGGFLLFGRPVSASSSMQPTVSSSPARLVTEVMATVT